MSKKRPHIWAAILSMSILLLTSCGVFIDMAEDYEWRWGMFGKVDFVSPIKLRVGVAPFVDEVGLGDPSTSYNMAQLMTEEFSKDSRLVMVPVEQVQAAMAARGFSGLLTPKEASEIGLELGLNAVIVGSISEIKKYSVRKGWRRAARILTNQRTYVDAVLAVSAIDSATGIVLVSRANSGEFDGGKFESDPLATETKVDIPSQEALEASLDQALQESFYRTLTGLSTLPFKAVVVYSGGTEATIPFGEDVGVPRGARFAKLETVSTVTNTIGETYQVMGAAIAELKVESVGPHSSTLTVTEGHVFPGDVVQCMTNSSGGLFW